MSDTKNMTFRRLRKAVFAIWIGVLALAGSASAALRVTVQPGDTLSGIAARNGVSVSAIMSFNGLSNPHMVVAGTTLGVPGAGVSVSVGGGSYTVRAGDTLSGIAARFGTSAEALARRNGIANAHVIVVGTTLRVSGSGGGSSQSATWIGGTSYTVRSGENLGAIAARFGISVASLARMNGIANPNMVVAGTRLRVPEVGSGASTASAGTSSAAGYHTVQPGENLGAIAARFGTSVARIAALNGISNPNVVVAGTRLRVPGATSGGVQMSQGPLTPVTAATNGWGNHPSKGAIASLISQSAANQGVDPSLVRAIGWQESGWWQGARSSTGAIGVMQLMPGTAQWIGQALLGRSIDPYSASDNIEAGAAYLAYLQRQTGSRRLAIASYYQGLGSVTTRGLYGETEAYVASVSSFIGRI